MKIQCANILMAMKVILPDLNKRKASYAPVHFFLVFHEILLHDLGSVFLQR